MDIYGLFRWDTVRLQLELGSAREAFYSNILSKEKLFSIVRQTSSQALSASIPLLPSGNQDGDVGGKVWFIYKAMKMGEHGLK